MTEKNTQEQSPIRILQVVTVMNLGGIESMLMTIYRNIDRSKIQFDFIVHREERGVFDDEIERLGGQIFRFLPLSIKNYKAYIDQLDNFFKTSSYRYQVIHSHINTNSYNVLKVAKRKGLQTRIAHAHIDSVSGNFIKKFLKLLQKPFLKNVTTDYFACSLNAAQYLFGEEDDVTLINNAIDTDLFRYSDENRDIIRQELGLTDELIIGHVGRFNTQKNHIFLLEIFKKLLLKEPNACLVLVGDGELKNDILNKISELKIESQVKLLGLRKDVPKILSAFDVFLFPSLYEGLSVASIEAQCAGLHMFVSDTISKESFITEHIYQVGLNDTAEHWADFILNKIETPVIRENSYKRIIENGYDIKSNVNTLEKFYLDKHARKDI